jgi:FdhD protein
MADKVRHIEIIKSSSPGRSISNDLLVVEEPLEIRVGYGGEDAREQDTLSLTMRTPGDDEHLCMGFLFSEGVVSHVSDVLSAKYCSNVTETDGGDNVMRVELAPTIEYSAARHKRNFYTNSSCGVCGKASIEHVEIECEPVSADFKVSADLMLSLQEKLLFAQDIFKHTGGVHACGLFDLEGNLIIHKEDVGRHNALDKLVGSIFLSGELPVSNHVLLLSGRISFELVQKAVKAGIGVIAAVGAPSSLAVELAQEFGVTLVGFLKESGFNIYTNHQRVIE